MTDVVMKSIEISLLHEKTTVLIVLDLNNLSKGVFKCYHDYDFISIENLAISLYPIREKILILCVANFSL